MTKTKTIDNTIDKAFLLLRRMYCKSVSVDKLHGDILLNLFTYCVLLLMSESCDENVCSVVDLSIFFF
jgi:hypothetical protein